MTKARNGTRSDYIQALCGGEVWAISPEWARTLANWATPDRFDPSAIVTEAGKSYGSGMARTSVRDGVGIMQIRGPLLTHENFMSWLFGFDTYESLAADFDQLMNDSAVRGIVLNYHSPGGMVAGGSDLSTMIYNARGIKPQVIVARAGGDMASMAYWNGSSADRIHVANTGMVGSIGTLAQFVSEDPGTVTVVSTQSPMKRPDLATDEGKASVQATLDALSDVFISDVARNRGVPVDTVLSDFGRGGVLVGQAAVSAGMADMVSTFDATFSLVRNTTQERTMNQPTAQATPVAPTATAPAPVAASQEAAPVAQSNGVQEERARVSGILAAFEGTTFAADAKQFLESDQTVAAAQSYVLGKLKAPPAAPAAAAMPTQTAMANEGTLAAQVAASAPPVAAPSAAESAGLKAAMTAGANRFRASKSVNYNPTPTK